jgi:GntR family transcriptional regulator
MPSRAAIPRRKAPADALTTTTLDCTIVIEQGDNALVFEIDSKDPLPLYAQLERAIRMAIATGRLEVGDRLPTVRQLAVDLKINANTVAKVYGELEESGMLETRRGVGTFVAARGDKKETRAERERLLAALGDRFLAEAAALGFSAEEAIGTLKARAMGMETGDDHAER